MTARRLLELLTRRPGWTLGVWGLVLALSVYLNLGFRPVLDVRGLSPDEPGSDAELLSTLRQLFLETDRILVVVEGRDAIRADVAADLLAEIAAALRAIPGVKSVEERLPDALRRYWAEVHSRRLLLFLEAPELDELARGLTDEGIRRAVARLRRTRSPDPLGLLSVVGAASRPFGGSAPVVLVDGYLTDREGKRWFVLVEPERRNLGFEAEAQLVERLEEALRQQRARRQTLLDESDLRLYAVGRAYARVEAYRSWRADAAQSMAVSTVIIYLCFAVCFRKPLAALVALLPIALSINGALLLGRWGYEDVHFVTVVFCVLLVGLGIDFAFHLASHYWLLPSTASSGAALGRLALAVERPCRGILLGGMTTSAAFLALSASSYPAVRQTGVVVAAGIVILLATSLLVLPVVLHVWPERCGSSRHRASPWGGILRFAAQLHSSPRRRLAGWAAWGTLAVLAIPGVTRLRYEPHPRRLISQGNAAVTALENLTRESRASLYPLVALSAGATPAAALERDDRFYRRIVGASSHTGIAMVDSLSAYLPSAEQQTALAVRIRQQGSLFDAAEFRRRYASALDEAAIPFDPYIHREYPERVSRALDVDLSGVSVDSLTRDGLGETVSRHLKNVGDTWYAATYLYPRRYAWSEGALDPFLGFWEAREERADEQVLLLGKPLRAASHDRALRTDTWRVLVAAVLAVGAVLWAGLGSPLAPLRVLAPVAVSAWLLAGLMGAAGIEMHFMTLAVLPVLFGIGVDDGVHVAARLRRGESTERILTEAGPGLIMTSLTTAAAFASLAFSRQEAIREFGECGAAGVLLCLAASVHLLPLLYRQPDSQAAGGEAGGKRHDD